MFRRSQSDQQNVADFKATKAIGPIQGMLRGHATAFALDRLDDPPDRQPVSPYI
jgi:hypothetical protein